jgi:hypothetical protein
VHFKEYGRQSKIPSTCVSYHLHAYRYCTYSYVRSRTERNAMPNRHQRMEEGICSFPIKEQANSRIYPTKKTQQLIYYITVLTPLLDNPAVSRIPSASTHFQFAIETRLFFLFLKLPIIGNPKRHSSLDRVFSRQIIILSLV